MLGSICKNCYIEQQRRRETARGCNDIVGTAEGPAEVAGRIDGDTDLAPAPRFEAAVVLVGHLPCVCLHRGVWGRTCIDPPEWEGEGCERRTQPWVPRVSCEIPWAKMKFEQISLR